MKLRESIERYQPFDNEEEEIKKNILKYMDKYSDVLTRNNDKCHFTSSGIVLNKERTKVLMVFHNIYNSWIVPGGHADGEEDLLSVAIREVEEETGLKVKVLDNNIYSIQSAPVKGHIKRDKYVSAHLHLDILYIMEADDTIPLVYREDESNGVKWIPFEEADNETMCDFIRPIHKKLIKKLKDR